MNVLCATGNLGADCRTNNVNGTAVANFSLAVKSGFGDKEQTVWLDCALWGKRAEGKLTEYLVKGQQVAVNGELGTREYEKDGEKRTALTLRVADVTLIGGKETSQPRQEQQQPSREPGSDDAPADDFDSDVPF